MCRIIRTVGKLLGEDGGPIIEEHELWIHNPIECVHGLIGNPAFREYMAYALEKTYADKHGRVQRYDEMWTGDWWWKVQVRFINVGINKHSHTCYFCSRPNYHKVQPYHQSFLHQIKQISRNLEAISRPGPST